MSSDEDQEAPERAGYIIMPEGETFDGRERVISRAAYDLQVLATSHSASCGHPGFVPDDYLEHLDGLAIETTITALELCTAGLWERVHDGYRILDWEAVEVCLDHIRRISGAAAAVLRPGPQRRVSRRRRILPGLRRPALRPALARLRKRLRLLSPRSRQEPGPALGMNNWA